MTSGPEFTDREVNLIVRSLPKDIIQPRMKLLPDILREWRRIDVTDHFSWESPEIIAKRRKRVEKAERAAAELLKQLTALNEPERFLIVNEVWPVGRQQTSQAWWNEHCRVEKEFQKILNFLKALSSAKPSSKLRRGRGQPRNVVAYLVIRDVADIFEWATRQKAMRGEEDSPFYEFAAAVWPVVFGKGDDGLPAALKNWAWARKNLRERSPCIANMDLRHPEWRLFEL